VYENPIAFFSQSQNFAFQPREATAPRQAAPRVARA